MLSSLKRLLMFLNLILNHGISPSTILNHTQPLKEVGRERDIKAPEHPPV